MSRLSVADLFFAELTGRPHRQGLSDGHGRPVGSDRFMAELTGESWSESAIRSSVKNPGASSWVVMIGSVPAKRDTPPWAGAVRQRSDYFSDYTGWDYRSESFTIDKLSAGTSLDIFIAAYVKGRLKSAEDAAYVMGATVTASKPRAFSPARPMKGIVDVEVGYEDLKKKRHFVKASWDRDKDCARVDIPVRVTFQSTGLPPDEFTITWFGNGDAPITPFSPSP